MKLLQVNTVAVGGSIPAYMRSIAAEAERRGWNCAIAYGRGPAPEDIQSIKATDRLSVIRHGVETRLFDRHGLAAPEATRRFIDAVERFDPDIIHLHNIHGYYLNYPLFFDYLRSSRRRVMWSLHDIWPITGHCPFIITDCPDRWRVACGNCPVTDEYPRSLIDGSRRNLETKRRAFADIPGLTILPVSHWLDGLLPKSILAGYPTRKISIDIDLDTFHPGTLSPQPLVLGVANVWDARKSPEFFGKLRKALPPEARIVLAGRYRGKAIEGVEFIGSFADRAALARLYASAHVFVNPTLADNYPLANREALACGTPIVSRRVGGAVEGLEGSRSVAAFDTDERLISATLTMLERQPRTEARALAERLFAGKPNLKALFELYGE